MQKQNRRYFLGGLAGAVAMLGGCGFQLRQAPEFHFQKLWLGGTSEVLVFLRRELARVSSVKIVSNPAEAEVLLEIMSDVRRDFAVGQTPYGEVREIQMRSTLTFRLWAQGQDPLATEDELEQYREYSYSETQALAKGDEQDLLFRDMSQSMAQLLLWRLASMRP